MFDYAASSPHITVNFSIFWDDGTIALDNPNNAHLVIYDCEKVASNCVDCVESPVEFVCGWCPSSETCLMKDVCDDGDNWQENGNGTDNCPEVATEIGQETTSVVYQESTTEMYEESTTEVNQDTERSVPRHITSVSSHAARYPSQALCLISYFVYGILTSKSIYDV